MTMTLPTADPDLVSRSLAGDRAAFGEIVARHQGVISALTYSATGNLAQSEDLCQEVFIAAWKALPALGDARKLRPWLCGIARNLIHSSFRRKRLEREAAGEVLRSAVEKESPAPLEQAISHEEEVLLWRSIERIPEAYREPLVLFYRQEQSVSEMAEALGLSEEAARQRLSRGRKLLHEEMISFVESTLHRSAPGRAFSAGVLAALPAITTSAKAAALGATAAKGGATAKAAGVLSLASALASPLMMLAGYWAGYKMGMDNAASEQERSLIKGFYRRLMACLAGFFVAFVFLCVFGKWMLAAHPAWFTASVITIVVGYSLASIALATWTWRGRRALQRSRAAGMSPPLKGRRDVEYKSRLSLLGLPLIHLRFVRSSAIDQTPVNAWIAIGDRAQGILFAFGGRAKAFVAVGGFAVGLVAVGGMAIGPISLGGFSVGIWSEGGLALGWQAFGGMAIGWDAAMGGISLAHTAALGTMSQAGEVNNAAAEHYLHARHFFTIANWLGEHALWFNLLWALPLFASYRANRRRPPTAAPGQ